MARISGQHERFRFLEGRLRWMGEVSRADLRKRFGISQSQVTEDLVQFVRTVNDAGALITCTAGIVSGPLPEKGIFGDESLEGWLSRQGDLPFTHEEVLPPARFMGGQEIFRRIALSIVRKNAVPIVYYSFSSGEECRRVICPHVIVRTAFRIHIRGWDYKNMRFADFVFGRIIMADRPRPGEVREWVPASADAEWHDKLDLRLMPHPRLDQARRGVVMREWMIGDEGHRTIQVRRATLLYALEALDIIDRGVADIDQDRRIPKTGVFVENLKAILDDHKIR